MKFTISVPDDLAAEADALATRRGMSRSALYAHAIGREIARASEVTAGLNDIYGQPRILLPSPFRNLAAKALRRKRGGYEW